MTEPSEDGGELVRELRAFADAGHRRINALGHIDADAMNVLRMCERAADFIASAQSRLALSEAREAACVEALKAFAQLAEGFPEAAPPECRVFGRQVTLIGEISEFREVTLGDLRCARAALSTLSPAAAGLLKIKESASDYCDGQMLEGIKALTLVDALCEYDALAALTRTER